MKLSAAQQKDLLQKEELIIAPHVQRGVMHRKRLVLKNCLTGTYLNVDEKQMEILALFRSGDVVPNVLNNLIRSSKAPALKDFYELILKAYAHQILERKEDPLPEKEISPYKVPRVPLWVLLPLLLASCVFALWSMWDFPLVFVSHWSDIGYAILLASLCLSAGHLLAGGVIRYFGGAVHRPGLSWFALPPHFSFNLRDSRLIHRGGAFFVGVARLLPFLPAIGAVQFYQPTLAVPLLLIFTLHLVPKRGLPMDQILQGLTGRVALDTLRGKIFYLQERSFLGKFADLLYEDFRYASVRTLFTVLWLTVLSLFVFFTIGEFLPQWWHDIPEEQVLYGLLVIFVWLSVIYPLFIIQRDFISVYRERNQERKRKIKVEKQRSRYRENNPPSPEERKLFFREAPVCRPLDDKDLEVLANKTSFVYHARKEIVFDEAHPDSNLKILYYGKVDVFRQKGRFRKEQLDQLSSGASINKAAKGVEDKAPRKYRCRPKSAFFVAESEKNPELDRVLTKMNSSQVGIYLAFLARTPPFASWSPELLELLASEASVLNFRKGQKVLQTDKANKFFYIVYEGELSFEPENSRKKNNRIFKPGAFFGELSVLRNALPAGNVVGIEAGQCLTVGKSDFIRFMTRFPEAILEMEKVASQTVGFPIFPVSEATSKV